jgi:pyridinium-3,5-bisthiocarboxylic acid mononucleotide nickel chelatase
MSRILYFDCFSGIAGDMVLGALLDAGLPFEELKAALGSLAIDGYDITAERVLRAGVSATKFRVIEGTAPGTEQAAPGHHPHRHLKSIYGLIDRSGLSADGRARAKELFQRLGEAEAAIHQTSLEKVHLHEVGALDSIIDIVGAVFALEWVGAERIVCSPLNVGGGTVQSAHGLFPVPAPATLKLLRNAPVYSGAIQKELVTPTGALLATSYASSFGPLPQMTVETIGYGAGDRDEPGTPNVLRVIIGRAADRPEGDRVVVIECEIDDMNPQLFGVVMDRLYAAGALEVFYVPVQMKKNRPGTLLTVVAAPEKKPALADVIFRETTTIGLRHSEVDRECLRREIVSIDTPLGAIRFKVAWRDGRVVNAVPEFEDCARIAATGNLSVKEVQAIAIQAYGARR